MAEMNSNLPSFEGPAESKRQNFQDSWNHLVLQRPPYVNCTYTKHEYESMLGTDIMANIDGEMFAIEAILDEMHILNSIKYKENLRLHRSKVFQFAHRIRRCMKTLITLELKDEWHKYIEKVKRECLKHLGLGHLAITYMSVSSVISRIWVLSKSVLLQAHEFYQEFRAFAKDLKNTNIKWIEGEVWQELLPPSIRHSGEYDHSSSAMSVPSYASPTSKQSDPLSSIAEIKAKNLNSNSLLNEEDLGEIVSREPVKSSPKKVKKNSLKRLNKKNQSLKKIQTTKKTKKLIETKKQKKKTKCK